MQNDGSALHFMKNAIFMIVAIYFKFYSDSFINLSIQDGSSPWCEFQYLNTARKEDTYENLMILERHTNENSVSITITNYIMRKENLSA